ncbi:type II CRISPR RNA-guided endonuclease Cas9 [Treponema denticola]|uniref:type II CRISPR RNA-guided endonuclease Cas9 n=1 Tax=Treponema denticola TaxID=158 RepID=UPI0020A2B89E|nr:type II CRISPR RNA-guided endonuclease Cas9 [Treponema denticola]UTC98779.1 type II CRISPR RNA-guided endonuclease Cas9 [Treponema denticola]
MKKEIKDYFLGLDVGTGSVGWAVTDTDYKLLKANRKDLWGMRCFETAETAEMRRLHRGARRRIERRKKRIKLLQELFSQEIAKIDEGFFQRMKESPFYAEDKTILQENTLFNDKDFTDKTYHKAYPTINHLIKAWIENKVKPDPRLLYLACHNIIKKRGHFLFEGDFDSENQFDTSIQALFEYLREDMEVDIDADSQKVKEILKDSSLKNSEKQSRLNKMLGLKPSDKQKKAITNLISGNKINFADLYDNPDLKDAEKNSISFSKDDFDALSDDLASILGDSFELLLKAKAVYNCSVLSKVIGDEQYLSFAKVKIYEKHKTDLTKLKNVIKKHFPNDYKKVFGYNKNEKNNNNYSAYVGVCKTKSKKLVINNTVNQEDFYKFLKPILLAKSEIKEVNDILAEIETGTFLPKQISKSNAEIPYQLRKMELEKILSNAEKHFSFLKQKDEKGLSHSEKIIMLLTFKIPYYIGPINDNHKKSFPDRCWVVKKEKSPSGKTTPWNFFDHIDKEKTAEEFITSRTNFCTYLIGESVLPKNSLLYSEYTVLNEINNLQIIIDGKNICDTKLKQKIYEELFKKYKKITQKQISTFIKHEGICNKTDEVIILGIDKECTSSLKSYIELKNIFGKQVDEISTKNMLEEIIRWATIYDEGEGKTILKTKIKAEYGKYCSDEQIKKILNLKFSGWGRLSRKFLETVTSEMPGFSEPVNIITAMRETQNNLMELLSSEFKFTENIKKINSGFEDVEKQFSYNGLVKPLFLSPSVKKMLWQTLKLVKEISHITQAPPKKIFIEMAKGAELEPARTKTRLKILQDLYNSCKNDADAFSSEIKDLSGKIENEDNLRLRSDKLYLYYTQLGKCMYCGKPIEIGHVFDTSNYDIDHIYPQSKIKDDSISNRVLVCSSCNKNKEDKYPLKSEIQSKQRGFWNFLQRNNFISLEKLNRLTRTTPISDDETAKFIARQLVETRQATKVAAKVLEKMFPETKIVYSKAETVSMFRNKFDIIKCREINDFHHAHDAYLNIVVGNVYNTKFTNNPWNFIKEKRDNPKIADTYNYYKVFDYDVKRNNITAWEKGKTIITVKDMLKRNTPIYTRQAACKKGGLFDQTIMKKGLGQHPLKKEGPFSNISKYGGYNKVSAAYYTLIEYEEKENKIRSLETIPLYLVKDIQKSQEKLKSYLTDLLGKKEIKILVPKIKINSLLKINGFPCHITGKTNDSFLLRPAVQFCCSNDEVLYFKKIIRFNEIRSQREKMGKTISPYEDLSFRSYIKENLCKKTKNDEIGEKEFYDLLQKKNLEIYDMLLTKHKDTIYNKRPNSTTLGMLTKGRYEFINLKPKDQIIVMLEILKLFCTTREAIDLGLIKGKPAAGVATLGKKISNLDNCILIYQSITGIFEKRIDLLKV